MGWVIIKTLIWNEPVIGYASLMSVIIISGGIELLSLGIIGEYLGRVFNETKKRPLYYVNVYNDEKVRNWVKNRA